MPHIHFCLDRKLSWNSDAARSSDASSSVNALDICGNLLLTVNPSTIVPQVSVLARKKGIGKLLGRLVPWLQI